VDALIIPFLSGCSKKMKESVGANQQLTAPGDDVRSRIAYAIMCCSSCLSCFHDCSVRKMIDCYINGIGAGPSHPNLFRWMLPTWINESLCYIFTIFENQRQTFPRFLFKCDFGNHLTLFSFTQSPYA
jgi:hypothetical protein